MFSLEQIKAMNAEAGQKARALNKKPHRLNNIEEIEAMPPFPFPNLGDEADNVDEVYERVDSLFCDSSGFGGPGERALTIDQLKRKLTELIDEHGEIFVGIESTGQFQLYLAVWKEKAV